MEHQPATPLSRIYAHAKSGTLEILFRQLHEPMPLGWKPGLHWQVEAYERGMEQPPVGFCWVVDTTPICPPGRTPYPPHVDIVRVFDTHQRRGVATALVAAAQRRWPNLDLGKVASPEGTAFLAAYEARTKRGEDAALLSTDEPD